jgi:hypothetical protein
MVSRPEWPELHPVHERDLCGGLDGCNIRNQARKCERSTVWNRLMVKLPDPLMTRLAARIESVLRARRWKRTMFAHGHVSHSTVRNVLHGKDYRLSTLVALAEALDCDLVIEIQPRNMERQPEPEAQHIAHES